MTFDIRKFLTENRITVASQQLEKVEEGKTVDSIVKAIEDAINFIGDNVPGGEEVDDTPNPVLEKLSGNQDKLDKNKDGKISGDDFKMMKEANKEVPNENAGKYYIMDDQKKRLIKSGFDTKEDAIAYAREHLKNLSLFFGKHKDTKKVYTKD